jgi:hypothetical protein
MKAILWNNQAGEGGIESPTCGFRVAQILKTLRETQRRYYLGSSLWALNYVLKYLRIFENGQFIYGGGQKMTVSQNRFMEIVKSSISYKIH